MEKRISARGFIFIKPTMPKKESSQEDIDYFLAEDIFCKWANGLDFRTIRYMIENSMPEPVYAEEIGYTGNYHRFFTYDKLFARIARDTMYNVSEMKDSLHEIISLDGLDLLEQMISSRIGQTSVVLDEDDSQKIHFVRSLTEEQVQEFQNELDKPFIVHNVQ